MLIHTWYSIWPHHCCGPHMHRHIYDVTTAIGEQWWSTGRQNSELHPKVGFCTIIIRLSQCTTAIMMVYS